VRERELQLRKFCLQPIAVDLGVAVENEEFAVHKGVLAEGRQINVNVFVRGYLLPARKRSARARLAPLLWLHQQIDGHSQTGIVRGSMQNNNSWPKSVQPRLGDGK
jgi:hypothetical protein